MSPIAQCDHGDLCYDCYKDMTDKENLQIASTKRICNCANPNHTIDTEECGNIEEVQITNTKRKYWDCIYRHQDCIKSWGEKPNRMQILVHQFEEHQGNLQFMSDDVVFSFIKEGDDDT